VFAPLAEGYRKVGMTDKAMEILSQGIRYNPSYTMGYVGLAFCYNDLKQFNLAYSTLRPLTDGNRDNIRLQKLFAEVCLELFRKEEALETYKYLLFVNPRDKEVAKIVLALESELEEKYKPIHKPIIIPEEQLMDETKQTSGIFDVSKLNSEPKVDFDDWLAVDLKKENKAIKNNQQVETGWEMNKLQSETIEKSHSLAPNISLDLSNSSKNESYYSEIPYVEETNNNESPIVTHTLVDLYCGQGHIEKALDVLNKILLLNPNDQKTKDKIQEINLLINPFEESTLNTPVKSESIILNTEFSSALLPSENSNKLLDVHELKNISEEDGRRALMNILDKEIIPKNETKERIQEPKTKLKVKNNKLETRLMMFLSKIKQRALENQNRL
jgi:tetratricopeptide (TPR) repeat protein